jgi:hypothetical protein
MARAARAAVGAERLKERVIEIDGAVDGVGANDSGRSSEPEHVRAIGIGGGVGSNPQHRAEGAQHHDGGNE